MAKLSEFRGNSQAIKQGEWVRVGDEYGDLDLFTRGFTDVYFDAQAARQKRAANSLGGDVTKIPSAIRRQINVECLVAHVVQDVRNLTHDDGRPVTKEEFFDLLRNDDFAELVVACFKAAGQVGIRKAADLDAAVGNSAPSSAGPSSEAPAPASGSPE